MRGAKMHFVYILKSAKDGGYYIGCTTDVMRRLKQHNSGKTQSLKNRRPLEIIYEESYSTASEAYAREKQIKSYKGGKAFGNLIHGGVA